MIKRRKMPVRERDQFVSLWLTSGPNRLRCRQSTEIDIDKRLNTLLKSLHSQGKALAFKPRG